MSTKSCSYFPQCQGCTHWDKPYSEQILLKTNTLKDLLTNAHLSYQKIDFISCGESGLRTRFDFTIQKNNTQIMGFYDENKNLIDIKTCLQLDVALQNFYSAFQQIPFLVQKGSVRLRVGPQNQRGVWLDFSNLDIKNLLEDGTALTKIFNLNATVEVGQKGKKVEQLNEKFKLTDPTPQVWFETTDQNLQSLPLEGLVSDFTQPSITSAKKMVEVILDWITDLDHTAQAIEFGPGLGQFTLPLLTKGLTVSVYESDASLTTSLERNAQKNNLSKNLKIHLGDFQNKSIQSQNQIDLAFVNPPRSGLKKFTDELIKTNAKKCIYISCFPESMTEDLKVITEAGYQIKEIKIVDQFPQTKHFETCVLLEKLL